MDIYCSVQPSGLVPLHDSDYDNFKKLKAGDTVLCVIKRPRNVHFHKKFFALVRMALENLPESLVAELGVHNLDDMLSCFKMDLGLFSVIKHGGRQVVKLESISFSKMDNTEFEVFYNRCVDLVQHVYLRGIDREDIINEIDRYR